jgi:hypothetical protein
MMKGYTGISRYRRAPGLALAAGAMLMSAAAFGQGSMNMSRYGGPVYTGPPALSVTASLVAAGGGPAHYSTAKALTSMIGPKLVKAEVAKLTRQYGRARVGSWLKVGDFAVDDALKIATKAGVHLPPPALSGKKLAAALVNAGLDPHGTFYVEYMLDKALSHKIHVAVMDDIDARFSPAADGSYHAITNQAMYDLAHALGLRNVKLANYH